MNVAGFMGLGAVIVAFAAAYVLLLRRSAARDVAAALLAIAGAFMVVVGFFPCDAGCVDVTRTGRLHGLFSMPGAIGVPVAAMVSALAFRRDGRFSHSWQLVSFWLGLACLSTGPLVATELFVGVNGLVQRAGMWPSLLWVTAVSAKLYVAHTSRSCATAGRDQARRAVIRLAGAAATTAVGARPRRQPLLADLQAG